MSYMATDPETRVSVTFRLSAAGLDRVMADATRETGGDRSKMLRKLLAEAYAFRSANVRVPAQQGRY